ncbi:MAG: DMT family transporter [Chitinivibrionales bacterium]|nr:DMT family transporter [Chitinivibrionales bacterium]
MTQTIPYCGETLALLTALVWAVAVILFKKSGESLHPVMLNIVKNLIAVILFIPTLYLFNEPLLRKAPLLEYGMIFLSGIIGIGISDTLFFASLNRLGAGMSAIVDCLYSPFIIALSLIFLGEHMSVLQFIGSACIVSGILTLLNMKEGSHLLRKNLIWGIIFGAAAMAFNAVGVIIVKPILDRQPLLWVTQLRLIGGTLFLSCFILLHPKRFAMYRTLFALHGWKYALSGSILGTYGAMILWLAGLKLTQASVASALNQTSTLFIFILASLFLKERITKQKLIAMLFGVVGVLLVIFY